MPEESIRLVHASGACEIGPGRRKFRMTGPPVPVDGSAFEVTEVLDRSAGEIVIDDAFMDPLWRGRLMR
jgi:hypothetical protein